jgi:hypothetical protein
LFSDKIELFFPLKEEAHSIMATSLNTFDFIPASQRSMYTTAFDAITQLELWNFVREFNGESFMFSLAPEIKRISDRISQLGYGGHSGASFGCTMQAMKYIANNGLDMFQEAYQIQNQERLERRQQLRQQQRPQPQPQPVDRYHPQ